MIEMGKKYRTDTGGEVTLHYVDEYFAFGYVDDNNAGIWTAGRGEAIAQLRSRGSGNLIEVKPTITRTYWLVHFRNGDIDIRRAAERCEEMRSKPNVIAITGPHEITFTEGEGL